MTVAIPTIETPRLRLRSWRDADLPVHARFCADPATAKFVGGVCSENDAWRRMATQLGHWQMRGYGPWALEDKATGEAVGYCGPWNPHGWPEPEIAWGLVREAHGKGFATEAARRALAHAFDDLGWTTAISVIAVENIPSIRVAERLGAGLDRTTEMWGWKVGIYRHPAPSQARTST